MDVGPAASRSPRLVELTVRRTRPVVASSSSIASAGETAGVDPLDVDLSDGELSTNPFTLSATMPRITAATRTFRRTLADPPVQRERVAGTPSGAGGVGALLATHAAICVRELKPSLFRI